MNDLKKIEEAINAAVDYFEEEEATARHHKTIRDLREAEKLVKNLTIPVVINCPNCNNTEIMNSGVKPYKYYCKECATHFN